MYVQVLFLLLTCVNIIKSKETDSAEAKYIDLLPEREKQEFLNKIAQRILAEIKGKNRSDGTSVEISDERLDEHDAYVQRIMEEETEKFKHKRRLGSQSKGDDVENDDASESKGKTIEKENVLGQDDTDSSVVKNNIRIKKDTNEEVKQTSIESRRINSEGTKIPVPLLYDEEINLGNTVTVKNVFDNDESVSDRPVENHLKVEGLSKRSGISENSETLENDNEKTDFQYKNEDNTKEKIDVHNSESIRNSYGDYDDTRTEATNDVPRTLINDFEPEENPIQSKINSSPKGVSIKSKSKTLTTGSTGNILDLSNGKFLLDVKSTKHIISTTPKDNKENDNPSIMNDTLKMESQRSTTYAFHPILRSEVNSSEPNIENDSMKVTEKLEENVHKEDDLGAITSSDNINKDGIEIVLTTSNIAKENSSNSYITTENTAQKGENIKDNRSDVKKSLRYGNRHKENIEYTFTAKYPLKNPNNLAATTENYKSHYHVFEISNQNSPFIPSEQANSELAEEPHYVPVYNYDPSNAFYTGYNYYGPNYGDNDKTTEINTNGNRVYKKLNKQNFIPDYIKNKEKKQSKNAFQNNRNIKFYNSKNGNFKPRSAIYQNHLPPAWKGGFSDISFNPNDYLDLEYYLGRNNDLLDTDEDDAHETSQSLFPQKLRQGKSEDFVDPDASLEHYNVKDDIAALRHALYKHKYSGNPKISDVVNKNYLKARFLKWKQKFDPVLRGLDDTFLIFLPGGKKGQGRGAHDDKNIAVDYYFSRMNSEEQPLSESNETYKPIPDKRPSTIDKSKLKNTRTLDKDKVIDEKRIQIPLNPDNILKIDLAVKDGNNINIIFRNVKKPEPDKFEIYLNSYMNVMKDMVEQDNKGLQQYHWLGSTVDVQSAIDKLLQLTQSLQAQEQLHYSDFELLKYILFVFQNSNNVIKVEKTYTQRSKNSEDEIPKTTPSAVSNRVGGGVDPTLKTLRKIYEDIKEIQEMSVTMTDNALLEFENFLLHLQSSLNKLHETIKEIATITNYKKQNWFYDLKHLYLSPVDRDVSLSLLLHLAASKLFGAIEDGARKGLEDNFIIFVQNHRAEVERTREDFIFVLRLLEVIKRSES